nr:TerB family tellurite resistance protein [Deltaproteobacteria bacterium]
MEAVGLETAAELCKLVGQPDLFGWLGVAPAASAEDCRSALQAQRKRLQAMQANPKYKDVARFVIKNAASLESVLADPGGYSAAVARAREAEHLPTLELMLDGVLADGVLSAAEETFVRDVAVQLGIGEERFVEALHARAAARGVALRKPTGTT